jgi:steroid delta-isomerase-like uncharacterized protein
MAHRIHVALVFMLLSACGTSEEVTAPPRAPIVPPPPVASANPTEEAPTTPAAPTPAKPALAELEKNTLFAWYAAFNAHDGNKLRELYAPYASIASIGPSGWSELPGGSNAIDSTYAPLFIAMPNIRAAPVRVLAKDNLLVVEWAAVGTNSGKLEGAPPTNKRVGVRGVTLYWFDAEGLIARVRTVHDETTVAQQLGKMPGRPREVATLPEKDPVWITASGSEDEYGLIDQMMATWPSAWSKRDAKAYAAALTDDALRTDLAGPLDFKGKIANLKELAANAKAFPNMKMTIERAWAFSPNIVVSEFTFTGTMKGSYGAFKATKKPITVHGVEVDELKDGKLLKTSTYENGIELLGQLSVLPPPTSW